MKSSMDFDEPFRIFLFCHINAAHPGFGSERDEDRILGLVDVASVYSEILFCQYNDAPAFGGLIGKRGKQRGLQQSISYRHPAPG